jgi:hypothetical protein
MPITRTKRTINVGIGVRLSHRHHGYYSDLISGVINTALKLPTNVIADERNIFSGPVISRFIKNEEVVLPDITKCLNIDQNNRIFEPYFDGFIPSSAVDREEYINELDILATI